jgi:ribose transport system substrate-binding protein
MKHRRIIVDIAVIIVAFFVFVIWYENCIKDTVPTSSFSQVSSYDVYLITPDESYQFWQYMNQGAADMAELMGVRYFWRVPEDRTARKQIEVINEVVNDGADALLVAADDPKLISNAIEDAKARGVEIVYVDAPANEEAKTTLATENYDAGYIAGEKMLSYLDQLGMDSGSIGIISIEDKSTALQREDGFRDALAAKLRYIPLPTVYTNGESAEAQQAAENLINQNSDLVGLFATNEGTTQGIGNAIQANNNKFVGIGFDRSDATMRLLDGGSLKAIINQNPYTMGYLGMAEAMAAMLGKDTGPTYINTGFTVLE